MSDGHVAEEILCFEGEEENNIFLNTWIVDPSRQALPLRITQCSFIVGMCIHKHNEYTNIGVVCGTFTDIQPFAAEDITDG